MVEITINKSELLALLFKLEDPLSAKALIRRGEDGKDYYIQAIEDETVNDVNLIHPEQRARINKFREWEKLNT